MGPLDLELVFDTPKGSKTITTTLTALAGHGLVSVSSNASTALDFLVDRLEQVLCYSYGNRSNFLLLDRVRKFKKE